MKSAIGEIGQWMAGLRCSVSQHNGMTELHKDLETQASSVVEENAKMSNMNT